MKRFALVIAALLLLSGCAVGLKVENPTDLSFIAEKAVKEKKVFVYHYGAGEKNIAEESADLLNKTLPSEGFQIVKDDDDADISIMVITWYFGNNEKKAIKKTEVAVVTGATALEGASLASTLGADVGFAAVPGVGLLASKAFQLGAWALEHGEKNYYMRTVFRIIEKAEPKNRYIDFETSQGGHFKGRGEAIEKLNDEAGATLVKFLTGEVEPQAERQVSVMELN